MAKNPTLSIIVATHNRANLLERSLRSLRAQSYTDFEIVIILDDADEDTFRVAGKLLKN